MGTIFDAHSFHEHQKTPLARHFATFIGRLGKTFDAMACPGSKVLPNRKGFVRGRLLGRTRTREREGPRGEKNRGARRTRQCTSTVVPSVLAGSTWSQ